MSRQTRKYELKARAERQRQTRERIVAATTALHVEVGPARTTIAEIARRAGVQRLTVYNSFPVEQELFAACQSHYFAQHPLPDLTGALEIETGRERLLVVLRDLYAWYRANEPIMINVERDRALVEPLDALLRQTNDARFAELADALTKGWSRSRLGKTHVRAAIALCLDFSTWRRLTREGLDDGTAAEVMANAVSCVAAARPRRGGKASGRPVAEPVKVTPTRARHRGRGTAVN